MSNCSFRQGFFLLRECPNVGTNFCTRCTASLCPAHAQRYDGEIVCSSCYRIAASSNPNESTSDRNTGNTSDSTSDDGEDLESTDPYYIRDRYYENPANRPTSVNSSNFDALDAAAFESSSGAGLEVEDDAAHTDFGDS